MMRTRLSADLEMRQVPYIKFHIDENLKKEREVLDLLRKIEAEKQADQPADDPEAEAGDDDHGEEDNATPGDK